MAADYDELRTDVKENQEQSLQALQSASAPTAKSVVLELDETDGSMPTAPAAKSSLKNWSSRSFRRQTTSSLVTPASWFATARRSHAKKMASPTALTAKLKPPTTPADLTSSGSAAVGIKLRKDRSKRSGPSAVNCV